MMAWRKYPVIYEINTWVWLGELSRKHRKPVTLATVSDEEWDAIGAYGFDAIWLMGVWERSPAGIAISMRNEGLLTDFRRALPDFAPEDNVGSPYCVRRYIVDQSLGGPNGLATARTKLAGRGMRLILDFVPNHVSPDHPWVREHPDYFIEGNADDLAQKPGEFLQANGKVLALGRDPYFPPWPDVVQLNGFHPGLRKAIIETVTSIADQCDGMRCDMAMLLMTPIFERTWGHRAGPRPEQEYWVDVIQGVRRRYPDVLFMAEAYWDKEWELQQQGFDYCYDKQLYDRLEHGSAESVRLHLCADLPYQEKLVRFIENHDEPRAAATFSNQHGRAAAVTFATLPGARLFHEGQFDGRRMKLPVFLRRRPEEVPDRSLGGFYTSLLRTLRATDMTDADWALCERIGWPNNDSYLNLVAWCWRKGATRMLVVVNLSESRSQGHIRLPWDHVERRTWRFTDVFTGDVYERDGHELRDSGLYVDLAPWAFHLWTA
jgi:hypothetical protein